MGANGKLPGTVTRSINWRFDTLAALDLRVKKMRTNRSLFTNGVMEHVMGIMAHPELVGRNIPFVEDVDRKWEADAARLEREETARLTRVGRKPKHGGTSGLIRRPVTGIAAKRR
jgi:hypothetical protein